MKFGLPEASYTPFTVVIVVAVGTTVVGVIVDAVSDVLYIPQQDTQATPDFGRQGETPFIHGLAKVHEKVIVLLDLDTVVGTNASVVSTPVP